ncbi:MAG TPA: hypothetical protein VG899_05325 [Mycobacteriales bacterium]|nr:hypothetical protein [Mycobacteriales bacterium]
MSWSWPLFAWGVLAGPVWVVASAAAFRLAARYVGGDGSRTVAKYAGRYPLWAATGLPVGVVSALLDTAWPDLVFTAYALLTLLAPLPMLPKLRKVAEEQACESGGACRSCPIACDRRSAGAAEPTVSSAAG